MKFGYDFMTTIRLYTKEESIGSVFTLRTFFFVSYMEGIIRESCPN